MEMFTVSVRLFALVILFGNQEIVKNVSGIFNEQVSNTNYSSGAADNVTLKPLSFEVNEDYKDMIANQSSTASDDTLTTLSSAVTKSDSNLTTTTEEVNITTTTTEYSNSTTTDYSNSTTESSTIFTSSSTTITPTTEKNCDITIYDVNVTTGSTQVSLSLNMSKDEDCYPLNATINCTDIYETPLDYTEVLHNSTGYLVIGSLLEYTNYTCTITIDGASSSSYNISFRTDEGVPGTPTNLSVILLNSTFFRIAWSEPENVTAIIDGYNITIERGEVNSENHFMNPNCPFMPTPIQDYYTQDFEFNFLGKADFFYTATVSAWSLTTGNGNFASINITTNAEASEVPHYVTQALIEQNGTNNINRNLYISWEMPCNTNGPVEQFVIELMGKYNGEVFTNQIYYVNVSASIVNYNYTIELVSASSYTLKLYMRFNVRPHENNMYIKDFVTGDNYPSAPNVTSLRTFARNFTVSWDEPDNKPGNITGYGVHYYYQRIDWLQTSACQIENDLNVTQYLLNDSRSFIVENVVPGATYGIDIFAETSIGIGNLTQKSVTSLSSTPEFHNITYTIENHNSLQADSYDVNARVTFEAGCLNGKFDSYTISYIGNRSGDEDHTDFEEILDFNNNTYGFALQPARFYSVNVTIKNSQDFTSNKSIIFSSPVGVPKFNEDTVLNIQVFTNTSAAVVSLKKEYFSNTNGNLDYLAIIVSSKNATGGITTNWTNNSQWPTPEKLTDAVYYQVTPKFWNPFKENDVTFLNYSIGENQITCSEDEQICNKALDPGKTYFVYLRMFNAQYYRTSMPFTIETDPTKKVGLIVGIIFGLLGISAMGIVGFILWRRGYFNIPSSKGMPRNLYHRNHTHYNRDSESIIKFLPKEDPEPKTELSKNKFVEHCNYLEQNPDALSAQWTDLEIKSQEIYEGLQTHFALLPENRRKNRYSNILPFDHTRVKLNIDEDDEICSDYINASFIKGFSNRNEYIATQGPLPHTVRDFWKMVFQENVTIIVMVAKFIENKRDKCYKYFPNNHESMLFGDDIEVKCCSELHFQIYCVRTLQVRKDLKQMTVTHMQFLEWPDHGVPIGTDNLLLFCHQLRNRWAIEGGMSVVHCSAGVGRTGTIIATDILIRAIEAGKKLDVFNTVLELRRQRKSMVQTEKQFMYIHQLIRNIIEDPIADDEEDNQEHVYQNIKLANEKFVTAGSDVVESSF